jgi:hypothetical protein
MKQTIKRNMKARCSAPHLEYQHPRGWRKTEFEASLGYIARPHLKLPPPKKRMYEVGKVVHTSGSA